MLMRRYGIRRHATRVGTAHRNRFHHVIAQVLVSASILPGCGQHPYNQWDIHLKRMVDDFTIGQPHRLADVSLLLGSPPEKCEKLDSPNPRIGVFFDDNLILKAVLPGSPGHDAGLRPGMRILSLDGNRFANQAELLSLFERTLRVGTAVNLETDQGTFSVLPKTPVLEQCYWDISGGYVERGGAGGSWTRIGGGAWGNRAAFDQYYRATCRFQDGFLITFTSNWQR